MKPKPQLRINCRYSLWRTGATAARRNAGPGYYLFLRSLLEVTRYRNAAGTRPPWKTENPAVIGCGILLRSVLLDGTDIVGGPFETRFEIEIGFNPVAGDIKSLIYNG